MKKYLVGGFVRDTLLGLDPSDRDWVVVGETPQSMIDAGYKQVGADFPVFLDDNEEHALARTERKTGVGYHGFETVYDSSVTLEDDLRRRDLTINAMAIDANGNIIDPFGGQEDLKEGILRHVSEAFAEDPVRVLRVARFAARYDFVVADNTCELLKHLVNIGELDALKKERVWLEMEKMIKTCKSPEKFFSILKECNALEHVLLPLSDINLKIEHNYDFQNDECNFVSIFYHVDVEVMEELEELIGIPKRFLKFFKIVKKIKRYCTWHLCVDTICLMKLFKDCNAWNDKESFFLALDTIRLITGEERIAPNGPSAADITWLSRIKECFLETTKYGFDDLTNVQKERLTGTDISWAIDHLRRMKMENNLFYKT